ncbi:MAG TPA: type II toxin-antitoxin system RelE/ParE family toxin [Xanthobacteraceae bacterium]|nr:type II toxin-antitoxin system RelE/ParE family toxin [Xanthobacteraceae bacterium]
MIDIWTYIARDNPPAADRLLDTLDEKCQALAHNPQIGMARNDIATGVRYFPVGNYIILYRESRQWHRSGALCAREAPVAGLDLVPVGGSAMAGIAQ